MHFVIEIAANAPMIVLDGLPTDMIVQVVEMVVRRLNGHLQRQRRNVASETVGDARRVLRGLVRRAVGVGEQREQDGPRPCCSLRV